MRESWRLKHWEDPDEALLQSLIFIHPVTAELAPGIDMFQASIKGFDFLPGDVAGRIPIQPRRSTTREHPPNHPLSSRPAATKSPKCSVTHPKRHHRTDLVTLRDAYQSSHEE